jgi:hypothetical protein
MQPINLFKNLFMKLKIFSTILFFSIAVCLASLLTGWTGKASAVDPTTIARSASKSLVLLQKSGYSFMQRGHCVSCHHNILTSIALEKATQKGISFNDSLSKQWVAGMEMGLKNVCNLNLVNEFITAKFITPYMLLGLYSEKYPANAITDIGVDYLLGQARPDGSFGGEAMRVPLESGDIHLASIAIHAIMIYAPPSRMERVKLVVNQTRHYLEQADPSNQQELAFQLMGLEWTGGSDEKKSVVARKLISLQQADGGWSQLPTLASDAYASGEALCALYESGLIKPEDEIYQKGVRYLLRTQDAEGAWIVMTRASPIQPFFTSYFPPYDENQYISAAASNWAVLALLNALPDKS